MDGYGLDMDGSVVLVRRGRKRAGAWQAVSWVRSRCFLERVLGMVLGGDFSDFGGYVIPLDAAKDCPFWDRFRGAVCCDLWRFYCCSGALLYRRISVVRFGERHHSLCQRDLFIR